MDCAASRPPRGPRPVTGRAASFPAPAARGCGRSPTRPRAWRSFRGWRQRPEARRDRCAARACRSYGAPARQLETPVEPPGHCRALLREMLLQLLGVWQPQPVQLLLVLVGVHRAPEAVVPKDAQLALSRHLREDVALQVLAFDPGDLVAIEDEEAGVDPVLAEDRLFDEVDNTVGVVALKDSVLGAQRRRGHGPC